MYSARHIALVFAVLLVAAHPAVAQEDVQEDADEPKDEESAASEDAAAEWGFGLGIGLGTQSFDEDGDTMVYQSASFYPVIRYGLFSLGLDLTLNYTFTGGDGTEVDIREEDWVPDEDTNAAELYLGKLRFLQWAQPEAPLYVRLGSLDDVTLGNGFIMGGYRNTHFLPDRRILGGRVNLDGRAVDFPFLGLETMAANLAAFDLVGGRVYVRPLAATDVPLLSDLQAGSTLVADFRPDYHADKLDDERRTGAAAEVSDPGTAAVWGADLTLPVLTEEPITLDAFTGYARQDEASGAVLGTDGRLVRVVTYGAQLRYNGENFIPVYFDSTYDLYRLEKYRVLDTDETAIAEHFGWQGSAGLSLFEDLLVAKATMEGPFGSVDGADNRLTGLLRLEQGLVPSLGLEARYHKNEIDSPAELVEPEDSVIDTRITYYTGSAAVSLVYNLRYDPSTDDYVITSGLQSEITLR
ncbi:MAG: hypothetical protein ACLFUX_09025 [Spirochaetaceae bacterium]